MNGTQYAVNICKQTSRTGDIVQLIGAAQPFSTQEDESDDIFTPIRTQTGYLRVIDADGTLLANLIPANNTERLVQLWSGTNSGGTFTPHALCWQGFLQAQAYTQPWDNNASVLELPVKSLLGGLEDVTIGDASASTKQNVAALILAAFNNFGLRNDNDLTALVITSDVSDAPNTLLKPLVQMSVFFNKETVNNEGDSYDQMVGRSYYEALSAVMSLYGLQLREEGTKIYMSQFDGDNLKTWSVGWGVLSYIASGTTAVITPTDVPTSNMLTALTFKGADNIAGYSQGGKSAKVTLSFEKIDENVCVLPRTTEDASEVFTVPTVYNGIVKVQPHAPRSNSIEEFNYLYYSQGSDHSPVADSYSGCVAMSVIYRSILSTAPDRVLGAFPVRWSFRAMNDSKAQILINGLMLNTFDYVGYGSALPDNARSAYAIRSSIGYTHNNGFLHLNIGIISFLDYSFVAQLAYWFFGNFSANYGENRCCFYLKLKWGNKYWNGTQWTTTESTFMIETDSEKIISNVDQYKDMTNLSDGYVIPITEVMSGTVQLSIMNFAAARCEVEPGSFRQCPFISSIINELSIDYVSLVYQAESQRSDNTYRQNILSSGFSEEKQIDLKVGTYNNNYDSPSFIKQNLTTYIEKFPYIDGSTTVDQRPELHLLDRMVEQFGQVRRMFSGIVQRGAELMKTRYAYQNRHYFGVKAATDWRDDTEEVRFIEV